MRFTYEELRAMAVDPSQPGAYSGSPLGEGNIGLHVHPGSEDVHVYLAGSGRVAVAGPHGTRRERAQESLPAEVRGLYDLLPE
jgi:oxalate decarboxylase/phosphoglucose isomerase-like protein (cupin superfamily)